jgi:glycosyltransferase involved in cell wall biosynthesis
MYRLFYISTNNFTGGSEILWYESALAFLNRGDLVSLAIKYDDKKIEGIKNRLSYYIDLRKRYSVLSRGERILNKLVNVFKIQDSLLKTIKEFKPHLVIVSEGNNIISDDIMQLCIENNLRFVTITQLVTELNWFWLDDTLRKKLVDTYRRADKCFFVSKQNLDLHQFLLAYDATNAELISNPYSLTKNNTIGYPGSENGYHVGVVGRIECFHKGLDILIHVLAKDKWRARDISFNLYGAGPHVSIISTLLQKLQIRKVFIHGFTLNIIDVWHKNHVLIQPSRMEGQSLALLEALNLNRTAIVTNVGGAKEIIEDNITGFIANVPTVESLDDAMERAWNRRAEWKEIGIKAGNKMRELIPKDPVKFFNDKIEMILK